MNAMLLLFGRLAGLVGVVACVVAVLLRLTGHYYAGSMGVGVLLQGGMAALLVACFSLLVVISNRP